MNDFPSHVSGDAFGAWRPQQAAIPHHQLAAPRPDFLVISPPKTGSTWLAANLRRHPRVYVPHIKEIKYFSSFYKWLDLGWYLDHFAPADGRVKGEASPSYALLPVERIRLVHRLFPDVKLIYLMRDPVSRAWSHAKHNHRYREANFASCASGGASVPDDQWQANFTHDWPLASGDYLGQLRRWSSVFPREQMYIGFYESIANNPAALLRALFTFLGVNPDVDLSAFPLSERILPGPPGELPPGPGRFLHRLLHDRTAELASFLEERFGLRRPPEWQTTPDSATDGPPASWAEFDDVHLSRVLAREETFPQAYRSIAEDHHGYRIVFHRGRLFALARTLAHVNLPETGEAELKRWQEAGDCFMAPTLAELKERVTGRALDGARDRLRSLEADLRGAREHISRLEAGLGETARALRRLEDDALRLSAKELALVRALRKAGRRVLQFWRRLRTLASPRWLPKRTQPRPCDGAPRPS